MFWFLLVIAVVSTLLVAVAASAFMAVYVHERNLLRAQPAPVPQRATPTVKQFIPSGTDSKVA
jgi:hypothetical protein